MVQSCFQVYIFFILIIIQLQYGISQENGTTKIEDVSSISPGFSVERENVEAVGAPNILQSFSEKNESTDLMYASNISNDTSHGKEFRKFVDASSISSGTSKKNRSVETVNASDIFSLFLEKNGTAELIYAPNIFNGTSERKFKFNLVNFSNSSPISSEQNENSEEFEDPFNISPPEIRDYEIMFCYELVTLDGVVCREYHVMSERFSEDDARFFSTKYLPSKAFQGMCIHQLYIDDPYVTVDENVFEGSEDLYGFSVRQSSIKVIPDFRVVKDSIFLICINSSRLTSLQGTNLQNLTLVNHVSFFNNSIRFIDPDVFKGTENVKFLDLSTNLLTSIPAELLRPMKKLRAFNASCNNLLHINGLLAQTQLQFVYLFSNNITDVSSVLYDELESVEFLVLSNNPIKDKSLKGMKQRETDSELKFLFLSHCGLREFPKDLLLAFDYLLTLDVSYNFIGGNSDAFTDGYYENFNDIMYDSVFFNVGGLNLNGNKLRSLKDILPLTASSSFFVYKAAKNQIKILTLSDLQDLSPADQLELEENQIEFIDRDAFTFCRHFLKFLNMSFNLISSLNGSIRYMTRLETLNLANNLIESFARDEFAGVFKLAFLSLQHNRIKSLPEFQRLPNLFLLDLFDNRIELIRNEEMPKTLKYMMLAENPLKCNCNLLSFIHKYMYPNTFLKRDIDICLQFFIENDLHENSECPSVCHCGCTNDRHESIMSADCSSKSLSAVPQFIRTQRGDNETVSFDRRSSPVIIQKEFSQIHIEDRLLEVNLENNSLKFLEATQLPPNLTHLFLANNKLTRLPDFLLDNQVNLKNVSLSGNPWNCDCDALKFKKWLTRKHHVIQDMDNVRCGKGVNEDSKLNGMVIWMLTDVDICPTEVGLTVSLSIGALISISFCLAITVLYNKYNLNIKIFLYSHGLTLVKEADLDYNKVFDAFLSFSSADGEVVTKELISVIEDKYPNIRLCIHYRHFRAGEFIYSNIVRAVHSSRRTVVILSKDFLESEWCLIEFQTAHMQALEDKVRRIIVIKFRDLPNEIDPAIKVYLKSTTYLTWGEKNFWNKLLYILPTGTNDNSLFHEV